MGRLEVTVLSKRRLNGYYKRCRRLNQAGWPGDHAQGGSSTPRQHDLTWRRQGLQLQQPWQNGQRRTTLLWLSWGKFLPMHLQQGWHAVMLAVRYSRRLQAGQNSRSTTCRTQFSEEWTCMVRIRVVNPKLEPST